MPRRQRSSKSLLNITTCDECGSTNWGYLRLASRPGEHTICNRCVQQQQMQPSLWDSKADVSEKASEASMKRKITAAQRRALLWLTQHDGEQSMTRLMRDGHVAVQTVHSLIYDKLVHARYARVWASGARPIESVGLTAVGRAAAQAECPHEWRQVELDMQQCERCSVTRIVAGIAGR